MKASFIFILLFPFIAFAQVVKTQLREKEILKENHVRYKKEFWPSKEDSLYEKKKTLTWYQQFDENGNLLLDLHLGGSGDTIEKNQFVYNDKEQMTDQYRTCKNSCLVYHWKMEYANDKMSGDSAFNTKEEFIATSKFLFDKLGRDSINVFVKYQVVGRWCCDSTNTPQFPDEFGFVYDTTRFYYSGDSIFYDGIIDLTLRNKNGFDSIGFHFYANRKFSWKTVYEYDNRNNLVCKKDFNEGGKLYWKENFFYDKNNLLIRYETFQDDMFKPSGIHDYEYTFY